MLAKDGLTAYAKFTNTESGLLDISSGAVIFEDDLINYGSITRTDNSEEFTLGDEGEEDGSTHKLSNSGYIQAGHFVSHHSIENQSSGYILN